MAFNPVTRLSVSSPPHRLNVSYDFHVFTDTAVVTATLDEDERYDDEDEGDDVVLHCGAELPGDEQMAQHLLTHTLSWYKIPNSLVTAQNSAASGGDEDTYGASASSSGLKKDLQLQVPDFHNLDDISFYVGSEEAKERERMLERETKFERERN